MLEIYWTEPALDDMDAIFEFIAKDAPPYAVNFIQALMERTEQLEHFPLSGRAIPEAGDDNLRELIFQGYRIMYWIINEKRIDIIAILHGSRELENPEQQPW